MIFTCNAIGTAAENEPSSTNLVVNSDVATGLEIGQPIVVIRSHSGHRSLTRCCRTFKADGHPAVVADFREGRQQHGVEVGGDTCTEWRLVERSRRVDVRRELRVTGNTADEVIGVVRDCIYAVSRLAGQVCGTNHAAVSSDGFDLDTKSACASPRGVVASRFIVALWLEARAIVIGCPRLKIRGFGVGTARKLVFIANAIAVGIIDAIAFAVDDRRWVVASAVIVRGRSVEVASRSVSATWNLVFVTDAISVGIVQAYAVAIQTIRRINTFVVVEVLACVGNVQGDAQFVSRVAVQEDLQVHLAFEGAICGELTDEDPQIFTGNGVGLAVQCIPSPANRIGNVEVAAGFEIGHPVVRIRSDDAGRAFARR